MEMVSKKKKSHGRREKMQIEDIMKKVLEEIRKMESAKEDREKMLVIGEAQRFEKELERQIWSPLRTGIRYLF